VNIAICSKSGTSSAASFRTVAKETVARPLGHLQQAGRDIPGLWRAMENLRQRKAEVGGWPSYCFLPTHAAYEAADLIGREISSFDAATLTTLFCWRSTQGIYRYDSTLFEELWVTPLTGGIPVEVLTEGLPDWCVYIALPDVRRIGGNETAGFFALVQFDLAAHQPDLYLCWTRLAPAASGS
jgi:hypothetical protein